MTVAQQDVALPHDLDAEKWTIGSMIVDDRACGEVFGLVQPDDFLDELAQATAWSIYRSWKSGGPVDVGLILRDLRKAGGDVGEYGGIFLGEVAEVPTAAHATHYARLVAEAARKRRLLELGQRLTHDATNGRASADIVADVLRDASEVVESQGAGGDPWQRWVASLDETKRRVYYELDGCNSQLNRLRVGPGLVTGIGGIPGSGKTALATQATVDAVLGDDSLTALIANVEMDPGTLLDRQLARLSDVSYSVIRDRTYRGDTLDRVRSGAELLASLRPRLHFAGPPFTMSRIRAVATSKGADIVLLDYLQRLKPSTDASDQRQQVSDVMSDVRELAMSGVAVIIISAMSRQGQFRESSEIEYGADSLFVLQDAEQPSNHGKALTAKCLKNRHGALEDIDLEFDGRHQRHTAAPEVEEYAELSAWSGSTA